MFSMQLSVRATDDQIKQMDSACELSEQLMAINMANRIHKVSALEALPFIKGFFQTVRFMAQANLMSSGIKYSVTRDGEAATPEPAAPTPPEVMEEAPEGTYAQLAGLLRSNKQARYQALTIQIGDEFYQAKVHMMEDGGRIYLKAIKDPISTGWGKPKDDSLPKTVPTEPPASNPINIVKEAYEGGVCPDCHQVIPNDVVDGQACANCDFVFRAPEAVLGRLAITNLHQERIAFDDSLGHASYLQTVCNANEPSVFLGLDTSEAMQLNLEHVTDLITRLAVWRDTGSFRMGSDPL